MLTRETILGRLPPYMDQWVLIKNEQYVPDIIKEICAAHKLYRGDYDTFAELFYTRNPADLAETLYGFCKDFIKYSEESKEVQTSALPAGILHRGYGDCKHYALFIAGVISSLNRMYGCCFDADFCFVGYRKAEEPYHVFVSIAESDKEEIWIDPTPGSGGTPTLIVRKPV